jgi:predicted Zn-dependent protease
MDCIHHLSHDEQVGETDMRSNAVETHESIDLQDLRLCVSFALDAIADDSTIVDAEICASWCEHNVTPFQYGTEQPDDAIMASQSETLLGIGILAIVEDRDGRRVGFASESDDLSVDGIAQALLNAKQRAQPGAAFQLPDPIRLPAETTPFFDPDVIRLPLQDMQGFATEALDGALTTLRDAGFVAQLHVQGHIVCRSEYIMIGNTRGVLASDTATAMVADVEVELGDDQSRGVSCGFSTHLQHFSPYDTGVETAQCAMQARQSIGLPAGDYTVIFSAQAMADLLYDLLIPALSMDTIAAGASPFAAAYGQPIAPSWLHVTDDGRRPYMLGSRTVTGEGLPTGATPLITQGHVAGFLADTYHAQTYASRLPFLVPRNGMRHHLTHQSFDMRAGIFPTNVVLSSDEAVDFNTLVAPVRKGIYVGRLWAPAPQGPMQHGDFTCAIIGPSFHIQDGQLTQPLRPGALRLQANLPQLLQALTGASTQPRAIVSPTLQSQVLTPDVRCHQVRVTT